jgi:hypothetical protein
MIVRKSEPPAPKRKKGSQTNSTNIQRTKTEVPPGKVAGAKTGVAGSNLLMLKPPGMIPMTEPSLKTG